MPIGGFPSFSSQYVGLFKFRPCLYLFPELWSVCILVTDDLLAQITTEEGLAKVLNMLKLTIDQINGRTKAVAKSLRLGLQFHNGE